MLPTVMRNITYVATFPTLHNVIPNMLSMDNTQ